MQLPIIVENVIYRKDNGFAILSASLDPYSSLYNNNMEEMVQDALSEKYNTFCVIIGNLDISEDPNGGQYIFVGDFENDPKRGKQFKATFYYRDTPSSDDGLKTFLMTLPHIKKSRSEAIIKKFGLARTIEILDHTPEVLTCINGINDERIILIKKSWDERRFLCTLYNWLSKHEVTVGIADKAYKIWGKETISVLEKNPYKLVDLRGIGFLTADKIAHRVLKDIPMDFRVTAAITYVLDESVRESNLCLPYSTLKNNVVGLLSESDATMAKNTDADVYRKLIAKCLKDNLDKFTLVQDTEESLPYPVFIYLKKIWDKEYFISNELVHRNVELNNLCTDEDVDLIENKLGVINGKEIKLDLSQKEAIKSAFNNNITVITGSAGTGKTTITKSICDIAKKKNMTIRLMSPTGKAAQVLSEKTGYPAATIHRSLGMKIGDSHHLELGILTEDIVLIDEISMCGIDTMYPVMAALNGNKRTRLVFVGDKNQLPSVSAGNFLSDILNSEIANVIYLEKIHRQDDNSYIAKIANEIALGRNAVIPEEATDIKWFTIDSNNFDTFLEKHLDEYLLKNKIEDLQIISPMKKGLCGVHFINKFMQRKMSIINGTGNRFIEIGFNKFFLKDRVMQCENNYEKNVFNGDQGEIIDLGERIIDGDKNRKERYVIVNFYGEKVTYYGKDIDELMSAWCVTVHKFQGSAIKHIMMVLASEQQIMMSKEILYTSISRASKCVHIFGHMSMWRLAPTRSVIKKRYTNTVKMIKEIKSGKKLLNVFTS